MATRTGCSSSKRVVGLTFRKTSFDILSDLLKHFNKENKDNLNNLDKCTGTFKQKRLVEYIFFITEELGIDPLVGYHAVELLQSFMVKHLSALLTSSPPRGVTADEPTSFEDAVFDKVKDKFPLILFSCVQLANKLFFHSYMINISTGVRFLQSVGLSVSKQMLLDSELMVCKGLDFKLNVLNPLTYVEILLEVLGHNQPSIPVEQLHHKCQLVLHVITLERTSIYESLLRLTTQCVSLSKEQRHYREKFVGVIEDFMLLGVGVIAVATFIHYVDNWDQVLCELNHITGISKRSIRDFACATLTHIVGTDC